MYPDLSEVPGMEELPEHVRNAAIECLEAMRVVSAMRRSVSCQRAHVGGSANNRKELDNMTRRTVLLARVFEGAIAWIACDRL
jgi:hypothetical protein